MFILLHLFDLTAWNVFQEYFYENLQQPSARVE